jgi:hypothetical protein
MTWYFHRAPGRSWLAAGVLLTSLLFGQLGIGLGLLAARAGNADASCNHTCPCEEVAEIGDAHHDHGAGSCPEDGSDEQCPPGCDGCICCPGAMVAVAPNLAPRSQSLAGDEIQCSPPGEPASGVLGRIYRPPEPSFV